MEKEKERDMTGDELKYMLKSNIRFKSLGGVKHPGLRLEEEDLAWWRAAKFGMFIHWGLYSILGRGEWVMHNERIPAEEYRKLAEEFNPKAFDADRWAAIAKDAGTRYMVMVARHHDGFALWDSPGSYQDFTSVKTAAKRDFVKEYVEACRRADLRVGLYYSLMDWRFPGYFRPRELLENALLMKKQCYDQVRELMSQYGKIDILWYDGAWLAHQGHDPDAAWLWEPVKLNQMAREYNPKLLINPRSGWEGDFYCDEGSHEICGNIIPVPWEKCVCIGSGRSWGWIPDDPVMTFDDAIRMFVNVWMRDGNILLNVGPDKDGVIPEEAVARLMEIGAWMQANGESIYGTRGGPFQPVDDVYGSTYKDNKIFVHILDWERFQGMRLPAVEGKVVSSRLLGGKEVGYAQTDDGLSISVPREMADGPDTIVALELDRDVPKPQQEEISFTG